MPTFNKIEKIDTRHEPKSILRGSGEAGGRLGDINSRHILYVKTEGLCTVTPIYHDDVD